MENKAPVPSYIRRTYEKPRLAKTLSVTSEIIVVLTLLAFSGAIVWKLLTAPLCALGIALVTAVPYVGVSLFRRFFDAPRPYELYGMTELLGKAPHKTKGHSFPSRHVFSAFVIAAVLSFVCLPLGIVLAVLGTALAVFRVVLGIHFVRDVAAGALIGIVSGVIGVFIVNNTLLSAIV